MVWIDWAIIVIIGISAVISFIRGFVREALSLIVWGTAFFVSSHFYSYLAMYLTNFQDNFIRNAIAISILFIITLVIGSLVNYVIASLVKQTGLSGTDRVLGVCFGVLRGILIVAAILFFLDSFTSSSQSADWHRSQFIPKFSYIIKWFFDYLQHNSSLLLLISPK